MSIKSFFSGIFGGSTVAAAVTIAGTALTTAAAAAAKAGNPIGDAAIRAATLADTTALSGADKKAQVIAVITPVIVAEAAKGGLAALVADVEQFAGMVVEEVVAEMKATPLAQLAAALLKALGIK